MQWPVEHIHTDLVHYQLSIVLLERSVGQMIVHCHNLYVSSVTEFLNSLYYCKEPFCRPDTVKLPELLLAPQDTSRLLAFGLGWLGICGGLLACGSGLLAVLQCHL